MASRALQDLGRRHAVAVDARVARPDAAVVALAHTMVRDLDQTTQVDRVSHRLPPHAVGPVPQLPQSLGIGFLEPGKYFMPFHHGWGTSRGMPALCKTTVKVDPTSGSLSTRTSPP